MIYGVYRSMAIAGMWHWSALRSKGKEKQNSLVRRFFPKGSSFYNDSVAPIARVGHFIDLLPRKKSIVSFLTDFFNPAYLILQLWIQTIIANNIKNTWFF